jgi:hypothetical protein
MEKESERGWCLYLASTNSCNMSCSRGRRDPGPLVMQPLPWMMTSGHARERRCQD